MSDDVRAGDAAEVARRVGDTAEVAHRADDAVEVACREGEAAEVAHSVGDAMFAADRASREFFRFELLTCEPGRASMRMTVRDDFLNGHGTCHGGVLFAFADSTFGFACNSHNKNTVAAGCSIEFLRPGRAGDQLTAEAVEQTLAGRHGIYDVTVSNQHGEAVALFRGKSAQIQGQIVDGDDASSDS